MAWTAHDVKQALGLQPHPCEGGWFVRTYESSTMAQCGTRRTGTAIYYLLEPETFSEMHRLASDEIFHFYAGDAVEQLQLFPDGTGKRVLIGNDLEAGERPQVVVPAGVWQGARLVAPDGGKHGWALLGCTVSPGFEFADYEAESAAFFEHGWPEWAQLARQLARQRASR